MSIIMTPRESAAARAAAIKLGYERGTWSDLVARARLLGYTVELVEYIESRESPGLLGAGLGVCLYQSRTIRIRAGLAEHDRRVVLSHELEHAKHPGNGAAIDGAWHEERARAEMR